MSCNVTQCYVLIVPEKVGKAATIAVSPDPLPSSEGLASETNTVQCSYTCCYCVTCVDFMKSTYAWENGAVWCVNHGLETYYWSCRSFEEEEE